MQKNIISLVALIILLTASTVFAQGAGAGIEWETLNKEVLDLHKAGKYDRAVIVAQKALEVAEKAATLIILTWRRA
jgi:hypothetical protein